MNSLRNKYKSFFSDVIALTGTTTAAKIIGIMLVPIVTRLYTPEDFGVVALMLAIVMVLATISALRYDQAIIIPASDDEAGQLVKLSILLMGVTSSVVVLSVYLLLNYYPGISVVNSVGNWLYVVPFLVVLTCLSDVLANWVTRHARYKLIGSSEMLLSLVLSGTRIGVGASHGTSVFGLIAGNIVGLITKIIILYKGRDVFVIEEKHEPGNSMLEVAAKYRDFPLVSAPTGILNSLFQKFPVVMLGIMFLPSVVGLYAMASRMARLPIDVLALPIRRIYMQRIAKQRNSGNKIHDLLIKTALGLIALGLIPFMILAFFGEIVFAFVLGDDWGQAGAYASLLVPWLYSSFVVTPASSNFVVLKRQGLWFRIQLYNSFVGAGLFVVGYLYSMTVEDILQYFSLLGMCVNIAIFIVAYIVTLKADYVANSD